MMDPLTDVAAFIAHVARRGWMARGLNFASSPN